MLDIFFDSDDELFPEALEKMYNNAISNKSDVVLFKIVRYVEGESLNYNRPIFPLDKKFKGKDFDNFTFTYKDIKYYILDSGYFAVWAKFYKKEFTITREYYSKLEDRLDTFIEETSELIKKKSSSSTKACRMWWWNC